LISDFGFMVKEIKKLELPNPHCQILDLQSSI
jgi:hypothetical protein